MVVTGPRSPNAGELVPMTFDTALAGSGIVAVSISGEVATAMFRAGRTRRSRRRRRRSTARTRTSPASRCPASPPRCTQWSSGSRRTGHNVVGYLPATTGSPAQLQAVGRARRALRSPRPRRGGQYACGQGRRRQDPRRRGRQRVRRGGGARRRCDACASSRAAATCCSASGRARSSG